MVYAQTTPSAEGQNNAVIETEVEQPSGDEQLFAAYQEALRNAENEILALRAQIARSSIRSTEQTSESFGQVVARYNQSWIDYYEHERLLRAHARAALTWQLVAASVVLVLVVAVSGLGVFLSYREVMVSLQAPRDAGEQLQATRNIEIESIEDVKEVAKQQTELILSFQKLQLTSAVTGVIILALSLAFLFLFLQSVFGLDPQDFATVAEPKSEQASANGGVEDE